MVTMRDGPKPSEKLDRALGKRVVAYWHGPDETRLLFEDGTILQWTGYYSSPVSAEELGTKDRWTDEDGWVKTDE